MKHDEKSGQKEKQVQTPMMPELEYKLRFYNQQQKNIITEQTIIQSRRYRTRYMRIILAILILLCLFSMPYWYFEIIRILVVAYSSKLAYDYRNKNSYWLYFWIFLIILFQPFYKISLGRTLWNIIDVIIAFVLLTSYFKTNEK
ncbi:DUF6804 family protein [Ornithobacterium rhinotracheale]|uniref:DUF6804 family protein n=1 Tax=Ornithobacterium rhinotracheale TaxID=28251 RepID=UPI003FA4CBFD